MGDNESKCFTKGQGIYPRSRASSLSEANRAIAALQARIEKLSKPVEDAEVRDWIDYKYAKANSYKTLGDALDLIERLALDKAQLTEALTKCRQAALPDPHDEREISADWLQIVILSETDILNPGE